MCVCGFLVVVCLFVWVVGGYLAFIGFFCLEASLAMMAGVDVSGLADWKKFGSLYRFTLLAPGLLVGIGMYMTVRAFKSPYVLPCSMAAIFVGFYALLWAIGASVQDARDQGWVAPLVPQGTDSGKCRIAVNADGHIVNGMLGYMYV